MTHSVSVSVLLLLLFCIHSNYGRTSSDTTALALTNPPQPLSCSSDQFACLDGLKCILNEYLCDGKNDCNDASDETPDVQCFQCADGKSRVDVAYLNDCVRDCDDGSDETPDVQCFQCADGKSSVNVAYLNDCVRDCGDGSDEDVQCY